MTEARWGTEFWRLARLSSPVALTQLGLMMTGVVDTVMLGRLGVLELGASALGNMWQWTWLAFGLGLVMGIDPFISQAHGRGDGAASALALQRGIVLAGVVSLPICACMLLTEPALLLLGQDPDVAALAGKYNSWKTPTVPAFLVFSALRQYLQGRTLMSAATWVMWIGNALNVVLNWGLIFGRLGMPRLEVAGAGLASSLTTVWLVLGLALWIARFGLHRGAWRRWDAESFRGRGLLRVARIGVPMGVQLALEGTAFTVVTLMAGWLGPSQLAAHQIALNMAALTFMVPLGVAQAATTRVGNLIGAGDSAGMKRAATTAMALGAAVMSLSAIGFTTLRDVLPLIYTGDASVVALAAQVLPFAGAFQLSDGTQVVAAGVLRGMGRPVAAAVVNLMGYYLLALPLAYWLAFSRGFGLVGLWGALPIGLTVVAGLLVYWVRRTARRPLDELQVAPDSRSAPLPEA